jgi:hypothetical protein
MKGWVQVEPPDGASTDDEFFFAPSLFRAHNARERLAMLAGVPAVEQRDSALLAQLQGASLSQGVSVGASLPQGAPIPTAEFSSLGLSSLRAGPAPTGRAPTDRTRAERRTREELRTACICSELPCICSAEPADTWRSHGVEEPMEPMEPSSVEALSLEAMEAQFIEAIEPPKRMSMQLDESVFAASARRTGLEECRARLEAAAASQWEYELLPSGTELLPTGTYLPPSSAMSNPHTSNPHVHGAPDRAWVQQVAREAISSREMAISSRELSEAAAAEPWATYGRRPDGWAKKAVADGWLSVDEVVAAADARAAAADVEDQWRGGGGPAALSSGWAAAVDIPPWHSPQIRRWCATSPRTLHPAPCTLHPAPCALHPAPCTLHPAPCTPAPRTRTNTRTRTRPRTCTRTRTRTNTNTRPRPRPRPRTNTHPLALTTT